jgi:hypothetical protein
MDFVSENRFSVLCIENLIQRIQEVWNLDYKPSQLLKNVQNVLATMFYQGSKVIAPIVM